MALNHTPDGCQEALITLNVSSVTELVSAQQRMSVLVVSRICLRCCRDDDCVAVLPNREVEMQQQKHHQNNGQEKTNRTLSFPIRWSSESTTSDTTCREIQHQLESSPASTQRNQQSPPAQFVQILNALHRGKNRLVLREWKQGACWWNLNMNQDVPCGSSSGDDVTINNIPQPIQRGRSARHYTSEHITSSSDFNTTTLSMARAEVAGYRLSRLAMNSYNDCHLSTTISDDDNKSVSNGSNGDNTYMTEQRRIFMPEVLYFSHDDYGKTPTTYPILNLSLQKSNEERDGGSNCESDKCKCNNTPWALMSYFENGANDSESHTIGTLLDVEVDSQYLGIDFNMAKIEKRKPRGISSNGPMHPTSTTTTSRTLIPCHHFPTTMIKVRHEFGFSEPHPRHGRVPTDECLDYSMMILQNVVIPIQTYFFMLGSDLSLEDEVDASVLEFYRYNNKTVSTNLTSIGWNNPSQAETNHQDAAKPFQYHDMIVVYRHALHRLISNTHDGNNENDEKKDERMSFLLQMLDECINALECEWEEYDGGIPPPLPPVLCHMDLQPQNLAFGHIESSSGLSCSNMEPNDSRKSPGNSSHSTKDCLVASVMDWEEACYADPRFELLLMCRKVLANHEQAEKLWQSYSRCVMQLNTLFAPKSNKYIKQWEVGPLDPWLKLESVHSICTLLLQSMDLLGGGRSPWETKPDLWGKIDRERQRLVQLGWLFCDYNEK